jgi:hypothetical protein
MLILCVCTYYIYELWWSPGLLAYYSYYVVILCFRLGLNEIA